MRKMSVYFGVPEEAFRIEEQEEAPIEPIAFNAPEPKEPACPEESNGWSGAPEKEQSAFSKKLAEAFELTHQEHGARPMAFHEKIKMLRTQQGLTLEYVAKAVNVDKQTLRMWENGETAGIRRYKIGKLSRVLNTTQEELTGCPVGKAARAEDHPIADLDPYIELLRTRGECLALLMAAREASRSDIELTISFLRALSREVGS
jgi:transcriptional regulator with XRE-family HTH domain